MIQAIRRAGIVVGATTATIAISAGASFAHECYIANQSEKAQSGVKSQVWEKVDLVADLVGAGVWTAEQGECVTSGAEAAGVRTSVTIMGKVPAPHNGVLGSKNPHAAEKAGDGKGIDHFFSGGAVGALIVIAEGCGAPIPVE
jgi:hypothetical protein